MWLRSSSASRWRRPSRSTKHQTPQQGTRQQGCTGRRCEGAYNSKPFARAHLIAGSPKPFSIATVEPAAGASCSTSSDVFPPTAYLRAQKTP